MSRLLSGLGNWIKDNRKKVWFSLSVNLLVAVLIFLCMRPFYETNDDLTMAEFVNGSYAIRDAHLVFQNYLLGLVYKLVYMIPGRLPWYGAAQYFVLWLSFSAITYVLLQKLESGLAFCMAGIMLVFFGYQGYVCMQFSKVAGIAAGASIFLLFFAVSDQKFSWKSAICGWILGCISSMYRFDEFLVCAALMTGIGLYLLLELLVGKQAEKLKILGRYAGTFLVLVVLALGLKAFDHYMYTSSETWTYYNEYNDARFHLMDYEIPHYEDYPEVYEALGLDENAYDLYRSWNFYDPEKFTIETMNTLLALQKKEPVTFDTFLKYVKEIPSRFFGVYTFYGVLVAFAFWILFGIHKKTAIIAVIYEILLYYGIYFYLYATGRYMVNRVDVGMWFALVLVLFWMTPAHCMESASSRYHEKKVPALSVPAAAVIVLALLCMNQRYWREEWKINTIGSNQGMLNERTLVEQLSADDEHLYIAKINTITVGGSYGPFNRMMDGILDNISWLGGWEVNTACYLDTLHRFGVENPYRDIVNNDRVYLVDHEVDKTIAYIRKYYDKEAKAVEVNNVMGCKIYKVVGGKHE